MSVVIPAPGQDIPDWTHGIVAFEDGTQNYAVVEVGTERIVALTGAVGDEDARGEQMSILIASIPQTAVYLHKVLEVLENLVRQYPEGPNNRTPAGKAARDTLFRVKVAKRVTGT